MKLYGYTDTEPHQLAALKEVSFIADPTELRKLAAFLINQADLYAGGGEQEHGHFSDFVGDREMVGDVIVCNPKYFRE
ncbi:hypothetical protein [Dyella mobilis]|uniref:Uncharacterized protein n=1 Tax=Dyella mobilis TaxID=1849582 RepID=A0ABS2KFE6_9GAMM|nr:hypothetical protein [Dyella mobilis]MBM7129879.1 hypothetical protein [Dyella mobilis]GLQ97854.1 hypothetical protein GCM10007863_22740 [Dyella mobilis]